MGMLNCVVVFVPLVDGFCAHAPEPVGTMHQKSVMRSRFCSRRHNGMPLDHHCPLSSPSCSRLVLGVASEPLEANFQAPAAEVAASSCLRKAAALAGLGLELWG
jgi:hypothetical protein